MKKIINYSDSSIDNDEKVEKVSIVGNKRKIDYNKLSSLFKKK
jgi:hypothetical protein